MKGIKGPKSALSDFLREEGINVDNAQLFGNRNDLRAILSKTPKTRTSRKPKHEMPVEIVNLKNERSLKNDLILEGIYLNLSDHQLNEIAKYLSERRMMNQNYFDILCSKATKSLSVYDCSMISDYSNLFGLKLQKLELYLCGQLKNDVLSSLLASMNDLEVLRITGGYQLTNFTIPGALKILDLTHCSRIEDGFIDQLNTKLNHLDELKLSFCYGLQGRTNLQISIDHLFICETKLNASFFDHLADLKSLGVKKLCKYSVNQRI